PGCKASVLAPTRRAFAQAVCGSLVVISDGELDAYAMRYDRYLGEREERRARALAAFRRQREEIARQEEFIRRNIAGQKTGQAKSRRKMLEKLERLQRTDDQWEAAARIALRFSAGDHYGAQEALTAQKLTARFWARKPLVTGGDLVIYRGDRIGIVGPNGSGKTTLLRALLGQIDPVSGTASRGPGLRIGYYDQTQRDLDDEHTLIEEIQSVRPDLTPDPVRNY